jgi:hypothetical protein
MRNRHLPAVLLFCLAGPSVALAAPLSMAQLDALATYADCLDRCAAGPAQDVVVCRQACGPVDAVWEKDGVTPVTRNDFELAKLERADNGAGTQICYRNAGSIVVPAPLCAAPLCQTVRVCTAADCALTGANRPAACLSAVCAALPQRTAADCADADADGIPAWLERSQNSSDSSAAVTCSDDSRCSFETRCTYSASTGSASCAPRQCNGPCTVFHLQTVAVDDQQVLVHLYFDYSPVPARVLEVHLEYAVGSLLLADARPLPNLTAFGHQLHSSQLSNGLLRLVMYGPSGQAIQPGPLVELVFQRTSPNASSVALAQDDALQEASIAPNNTAELRQQLHNDALWGPVVDIPARADAEANRLLLHYTFDDPDRPLEHSAVPTADALCERIPACKDEPDAVEKARFKARLTRLQKGSIKGSGSVEGVSRGGLLLNGQTDHLRLPVAVMEPYEQAGQSFTFSAWVYPEGADAADNAPQLVFSQVGPDERTRFGLLIKREPAAGTQDRSSLQFFTGDVVGTAPLTQVPVGSVFDNRTWQHVAMSVNAATGQVLLYLNGSRVGTASLTTSPAAIQCPGFLRGSDVVLHEEGDFLGGRIPEVAYLAPRKGPFFEVDRMDLDGFASQPILANGRNNHQDADYLPLINRIAYSTDATGNFEIFIAESDGSNPVQVTKGFGDTGRNVFARHPRWAPDGTGLVFESNIFSVPDEHNIRAGSQLYYVPFNPQTAQVALPLEGGGTATQLEYAQLLATQTIGSVQLTSGDFNHSHGQFLAGVVGTSRGDVVFERADLAQRGGHIRRVNIPRNLREATSTAVEGLNDSTGLCADPRDGTAVDISCAAGSTITSVDYAFYGNTNQITGTCADAQFTQAANACGADIRTQVASRCVGRQSCTIRGTDYGDSCPNVVKRTAVRARCSFPAASEQRLLAASVQVTGIGTQATRTPVILYTRRSTDQLFVSSNQFDVSVEPRAAAGTTPAGFRVSVRHVPSGYATNCWDQNRNGTFEAGAEDLNGDGAGTTADCLPSEAFLFVRYDPAQAVPQLQASGSVQGSQSAELNTLQKQTFYAPLESSGARYVRVDITSPRNVRPLPAGVLATVQFNRVSGAAAQFSTWVRDGGAPNELLIKRFTPAPSLPSVVALNPAVLTDPVDGAFSPDGSRLLLSGMFQNTRPVLVRTQNTTSVTGAVRLGEFYAPVRGISWVREESYQACNWVGGSMHPNQRVLVRPMRGALDDLKMYAGVRDEDAIRSEAALGTERLVQANRTASAAPRTGPCATHNDCGPYNLCQAGRCAVVSCNPTSPTACAAQNARCSLRPASVRTGDFDSPVGPAWVCAVDCSSDAECFTQTCTNGPCRYCEEQTGACVECRNTITESGGFVSRQVEGCPDRNSFMCESGACETECYAIRDGQSVYRCDPTLEFCRNGRCESLRWDWSDVAPATLSGLGETSYANVPGAIRTVAVGEGTAIEIKAYGKGDYGHSPELLVEAQLNRSGGISPGAYYAGEWFRVGRVMVDNRTKNDALAHPYVLHVPHPISDLRMRLVHTPYENLDNTATGLGSKDKDFCVAEVGTGSQARCKLRPPGSRQHLGYAAEVPFDLQARECARGHSGCPSVADPLRRFLGDGTPSILVTEVRANGTSVTMDANPVCTWEGTLEPLASNGRRRKLVYGNLANELSASKRKACPGNCTTNTSLLDFRTVSNGAYGLLNCNFNDPATNQLAVLDFSLPPYVQRFQSGAVRETANSCFVEVDPVRREQCFEFMGGDVSLDVLGDTQDVFQTLEINLQRSFAHDDGFTRVNTPTGVLRVAASGLQGGWVVRVRNARNGTTLDLTGSGTGTSVVTGGFSAAMPVGQRFELEIATQPIGGVCQVTGGAVGTVAPGGSDAQVTCRRVGFIWIEGGFFNANSVTVELRPAESLVAPSTEVALDRRYFYTLTRCTPLAPFACRQYLPPLLPDGSAYTVSIATQPTAPTQECSLLPGSPTTSGIAQTGSNGLIYESGNWFLFCVDTPNRQLGGAVSGLAGSGLRLRNTTTSEVVAVAGAGAFRFPTRLPPGSPYNVVVDQQPLNQQCVVSNAQGTMPNADVLNINVTCSNAPTYTVSLQATGVVGLGLTLALNGGDPLVVPADGVHTFASRLLTGASYTVAVSSQPVTPDQNCQVVAGSGTVAQSNVGDIRVICGLAPTPGSQFTVGGRVTGMLGSGLRLSLSASTASVPDAGSSPGGQQLDLDRNGSFTFRTPSNNNDEYMVRVVLQPVNPPQTCTATNNAGRIQGANISNITITCAGASTMNVRFNPGPVVTTPESVRLVLFASDGTPKAQSRSGAVLGGGGGVLSLVDFGTTESNPPDAALRPGNYTLVGITNSNRTTAAPIFNEGDLGFVEATTVPVGGSVTEVAVPLVSAPLNMDGSYGDGLVPTTIEPVSIRGASIPADASVTCHWLVRTGVRPALPLKASVATSTLTCAPEDVPCFRNLPSLGTMGGTTSVHTPLVPGTYDLLCWLDRSPSGRTPDNILGTGDRVGFTPNAIVDGPGILTTQAVVTLDPP